MSCFLPRHLHRVTVVPGLLDGLHPLVALTLLLGPQLQRLLPVVTEHNEEVVLGRHREKKREQKRTFALVTLTPHTQLTPLVGGADALTSHRMFFFFLFSFLVVAPQQSLASTRQTYGADIRKRFFPLHLLFTLFSRPNSSHVVFPLSLHTAGRANTFTHRGETWWDCWGRVGAGRLFAHWTETWRCVRSSLLFAGLLSSPALCLQLPVCLCY